MIHNTGRKLTTGQKRRSKQRWLPHMYVRELCMQQGSAELIFDVRFPPKKPWNRLDSVFDEKPRFGSELKNFE